ncbi:hypothetical protein O181_024124 [Austropuccinia psidii MF-1]|uniref:Uncharacterized protein n=1 Tax=Austropuccinia psidii MF-1 TaxID=1389203 RepID=A0A9Q3CFP4_9BASI|nr:hypothetical protein [Austropuccinia psidii MF-1]
MLANKNTGNAHLLFDPSNHVARGVPAQDALVRTPLGLKMMKEFLSGNGLHEPKLEDRSVGRQLSLFPQVLIFPPPLQGHHLMVTSLLDQREVIIWPMKDGNGERTFNLGLIVTISCHPWDSNIKRKTHQIPGNKKLPFLICLASKLRSNQLQAQVAPNGWRTCSKNPPNTMSHLFNPPNLKSHHMRTLQLVSLNLRWLRHNPQRNLLVIPHFNFFTLTNFPSPLIQPFPALPATPHSFIIIDKTPVGSPPPPPSSPPFLLWRKAPLIPKMRVGRNLPTCDQP